MISLESDEMTALWPWPNDGLTFTFYLIVPVEEIVTMIQNALFLGYMLY